MIKTIVLSLALTVASIAVLLHIPPQASLVQAPPAALELLNHPANGRGTKLKQANLISIQPHLTALDYATSAGFEQKLRAYLLQAQRAGWLSVHTLVVFPEHIGTWLVAEGESFLVFSSKRADTALLWSALGNLPRFLQQLVEVSADDPFAAALFQSKSPTMAEQYQGIFSRLAKEFAVTVVAGSIVLPNPVIRDNRIRTGDGPLYNSSFLFYADGRVAGPVRKVYPIDSERPFIQPAVEPLPTFATPLGRLAILICADSWYPDTWEQVAAAELVAVPSFSSPDGIWEQPWAGYNGAAAPHDVDLSDIGRLSEGEAWRKYALAGRGGNLRAGINTFFRGDLWDLGDDGRTTAVLEGETLQGQRRDGAIISSLWLQ